ncbi:hypothetical protein ACROYT_G029837 [Oculina patagonica]
MSLYVFRRVNTELALKCRDADLLILEGMGRAIHTNYEAKFTCDSIKLAVIKNRWLAQRLGGDMYSVVFKYEQEKKALFTTTSIPIRNKGDDDEVIDINDDVVSDDVNSYGVIPGYTSTYLDFHNTDYYEDDNDERDDYKEKSEYFNMDAFQ